MMFLYILLTLFLLAFDGVTTVARAQRICYNVKIPITVTSINYIWGLSDFQTNHDVGNFVTEVNRRDAASSFVPFSGQSQATASYTIAGSFCAPANGDVGTVLVASHGLLMDRYYWDSGYQPANYSFVDYAVSKGYSVFYYDRLGAGESSVPSGYVNQAPIQLAILEQLTRAVQSGVLNGAPKFCPKKVVLVGHSFGSFLSAGLLSLNATAADGAVLTGMSYYGGLPQGGLVLATLSGRIASGLDYKYSGYDTGYTYCVDEDSCTAAFFKDGHFDSGAATYLYNHGWPAAVMEEMTILAINITTTDVVAPVLFFDGEYDFVECGGFCPGVLEPAARNAFPNSVGYGSYIQPNTGHILTYSSNATAGYQVIMSWLAENGF